MPSPVGNILRQAAELNAAHPQRTGNVVELKGGRDVIVAGDIHGNRDSLHRIITSVNLGVNPSRTLVLQEIIHGPPDARTHHDRSIEQLVRAARLKIAYPDQVVFILGNHDVAQFTGNEVSRGGRPSCKTFNAGVTFLFGQDTGDILAGLDTFILSMPLVVRCPNKVLLSHSLPATGRLGEDPYSALQTPYDGENLRRGGCIYEWTWGRRHEAEHLAGITEDLDVGFVVLGHMHPPDGWEWIGPQTISLACDHDHPHVMQFRSDTPVTPETAPQMIRPVASLGEH